MTDNQYSGGITPTTSAFEHWTHKIHQVDENWAKQFSNQHNDFEQPIVTKQEVYSPQNLSKKVKANMTLEERKEIQDLVYTFNEHHTGVITEIELDRHLYHAYKIGANELSFMTGEPIKVFISGYIFKLSKRTLSPDDMNVINARLYGANNIGSHLSQLNDANTAYSISLKKLPADLIDGLTAIEKEDFIRFRVNITPIGMDIGSGQECSLRVIKPDPMTFDEMDVETYIREAYARQTDGLIVICGATGNGKTSLLSGFNCDMIFSGRDLKIITYEHPIEIRYDKLLKDPNIHHNVILTQTEIHTHLKTFQDGVVNSLRRAAQVAIVGESRDYSTIAASLEFSQTGGLLFTTLHVNNSVGEALYRMVNMFPENERMIKVFEIIEAMRLCVIQRLEKSLKGGRVAIREALEFTPAIISELREEPDLRSMVIKLKTLVKKHGFSMADSARRKYAEGHLTQDRLAYYEKLDAAIEKTDWKE